MNNLTELPHKWCIVWKSKEIFEITNKWSGRGFSYKSGSRLAGEGLKYAGYISYTDKDCGDFPTEITIEQFNKWVLKSEPEERLLVTIL